MALDAAHQAAVFELESQFEALEHSARNAEIASAQVRLCMWGAPVYVTWEVEVDDGGGGG